MNLDFDVKNLIVEALEARKFAYTPYSHFNVGAALLANNGSIYRGCNIENAAYSPTNCAERTAIFKAVSEGVQTFKAIAIVGGLKDNLELTAPCGVCRQVLMEFGDYHDFILILAKSESDYQVYRLDEILPLGFGKADLKM